LELEKRQREWAQGVLARPGINRTLPGTAAGAIDKHQGVPTEEPDWMEVAMTAGWWLPTICDGFVHGISHRYPPARFNTKEEAAPAATAIQLQVADPVRVANATKHWSDEDLFRATANPRFVAVAENEIPPHELVVARAKANRLAIPETQSLEGALLNPYLP